MLREAMPASPQARRILLGTIFSSLGRGFTLPFLFIYLTEVHGISGSTAGLLIGWFGLLSLIAAPVGGTLIDRFGARRVVLPALVLEGVSMGGLALAGEAWQFALALTFGALAGSSIWAGQNTILTSVTGDGERQKVFGLQFALLNLGIGVGAAISGSIVDTEHLPSFQLIYALNMLCYFAPVVVLMSMPGVGLRLVEPRPATETGRQRGYLEVLRHRPFRRLILFSLLLTTSGYAQLEVGFSGFAINVAGVTPQIVGYAFTANTLVIVLAQLFVIKKIEGRSRAVSLALVGAIFAASWILLGLAGLVDGTSAVLSALGVVAFTAVFAMGETLLSPTLPTLVNALATDELRGRYNALAGMVWGVSGVVAPVSAGPLLQHGLGGVWIALVIAGCLTASVIALSLRRLITLHEDGRTPPTDTTPPDTPINPTTAPSAALNPTPPSAATNLTPSATTNPDTALNPTSPPATTSSAAANLTASTTTPSARTTPPTDTDPHPTREPAHT